MNRAHNQWEKANVSYQNYIDYIEGKHERFELTFIDLFYIRNFKGGNSSVHEEESSVNDKLKKWSEYLEIIHKEFGNKQLRDLSREELNSLKSKVMSFINLILDKSMAIDGFKSSYASALLHFYFPDLIPILDRRVLNGLRIQVEKNNQGQVKKIKQYYPILIENFYMYLRSNSNKSLRDYDKENFISPVKKNENSRV